MEKNIIFIFILLVCCFPMNTFGERIQGDCVNGQGTLIFSDGEKYVGEWKNDMRDGQGFWFRPKFGKYEGKWKNNECNGEAKWKGVLTVQKKSRMKL